MGVVFRERFLIIIYGLVSRSVWSVGFLIWFSFERREI